MKQKVHTKIRIPIIPTEMKEAAERLIKTGDADGKLLATAILALEVELKELSAYLRETLKPGVATIHWSREKIERGPG